MEKRQKRAKNKIFYHKLRTRLLALVLVALIPLLSLSVYLIFSLHSYSEAYDDVVNNMAVVNKYNMTFKDQLDESIYKIVVGATTFETIDNEDSLENPYTLIDDFEYDCIRLIKVTDDKKSRDWLQSLFRNLNTLKDRVDDIGENVNEGGHYDENIAMLDSDIYILTELIQEDITNYIYYQAQNMEILRANLDEQVEAFVIALSVIIFLVVVLILLVAFQISVGITTPVNDLVDVTAEIATGNFSARAMGASTKEIDYLSDSVNAMAEDLESLVEQIKADERSIRKSELRLLQEQINPHFLYNTLDTIVWLIEGGLTSEAESMVVYLSDFFRMTLSQGRDIIPIESEIKHVQSYLSIQQIRYKDILEFEIDVDEAINSFMIPKVTIQPMVENALYHGIKYKRALGKILITGRLIGEEIELKVSDNGVGMEEDILLALRSEISKPCSETKKGFGLANVSERLRVYFGEEYGLNIDSTVGVGTEVTLRIPARKGDE